ncbi:MAG: efflux RND transporter permease subunit [Candidatus Riflebacteria bacterium]|nr:efflux RND transporter permease subunit [Candidatus Riflebacteria bacterium]
MEDVDTCLDFVRDEVKSRLERVQGVAAANIFGGRERQLEVVIDPYAVAQRGLTLAEVAARLAAEDRDVSAGDVHDGKRAYIIRMVGALEDPSRFERIVLRDDPQDLVYLRDVATVRRSFKDSEMVGRYKGVPCLAMNVQKRSGSNILEVMDGVQEVVRQMNASLLPGRGLQMVQAYDATLYIREALVQVRDNIVIGSLLAVMVLYLFLFAFVPTLIISVAIPISAVGTFIAMYLLGRNINIVSLAGISFAVGMLVDNSIVVLENIFTRTERGEVPRQAAVRGTTEVWLAVLASTLTTVAVFLPIFFLQAEVAQIFKDIAIAIACAVTLSLVVSVLVIPSMAAHWMTGSMRLMASPSWAKRFVAALENSVRTLCRSVTARLALVLVLTAVSLAGSWLLLPPTEYLPSGNHNLLFGILIPPAGYNLDEFERIAQSIERDLTPLWSGPNPKISVYFYVAFARQAFLGVGATKNEALGEIRGPVQAALSRIPGMIAVVIQPGLFDQGVLGGRSIDLQFQGPKLERLVELARRSFGAVMQHLPGAQTQPIPGLELGQPELRIEPDRERLAEVGMSASELGFVVDVLNDGARISEVRTPEGRKIDLTLRGARGRIQHTQDLEALPIHVPREGLVPLSTLARFRQTLGPDIIHHFERERAFTLRITPPPAVPMEQAMQIVREKIAEPLEKEGLLEGGYKWQLSGTADKLTSTRLAMQGQFAIAALITYLLMASLFESFLYPLVIMFSVPLAAFGGVAALRCVHLFVANQALDVIAMLGFIILVGTVVNNAILLVDRALRSVREEGLSPADAVAESVSARIRPVLMSTLTSIFGMAPLVVMTGAGSELYRGIGAVVTGGLLLSTVFTLVLIPALMSLVLDLRLRLFPGRRV